MKAEMREEQKTIHEIMFIFSTKLQAMAAGLKLRAGLWLWLVLAGLAISPAQAQWKSTTYTLKGGWNSIFLAGDASYDTLDALLPSAVVEVWRWNPNPTQVGFTDSPLIPAAGTAEWSVWKRGIPAESSLSQLIGQSAYLVKCSGTTANSYSVNLKQSPQLPANNWVRNGANLMGFPSLKNGGTYPTMSGYFATFPAAIAANTKVYKYVGGDLGAGNPMQVFAPTTERLDATQAYWFSSKVTGDFYAPVEISPGTSGGLVFGRDGAVIKVLVRNLSAAAVTLTLTLTPSETAPSGQTGIVGAVPLTRRVFNATSLQWTETPITAGYTEAIDPTSTVELNFGINRGDALMSAAASNAFFASLLRITDSSNLMDVYVPVTAQKASLAGLWVGDVSLTNVSNKVSNGAQATATVTDGVITGLTIVGAGGFGYSGAPIVTIAAPHANSNATATATASVSAGAVSGIAATATGSGYTSAPSVTLSPPSGSATATATASMSNGTVAAITLAQAGGFYATAPTISIAAPPPSVTAAGSASVNLDKTLAGISLANGGYYYATAPTVTIDAPAPGTATATAVMTGDVVTGITLNDPGHNYTSAPTVTIAAQPGAQATATAILSATKTLASIYGVTGGGYYTSAPTVTIAAPPTPINAAAGTVSLSAGSVTGIAVATAGTNYTDAPSVTLSAPPTFSAATVGTVTVTNKTITNIQLGSGGGYYSAAPTVTVSAPTAAVTAAPGLITLSATGTVSSIALGTAGTNYTTAPTVGLSAPPASVTATGTAVISSKTLASITLGTGGGYYSVAPTVTVSAPTAAINAVPGAVSVSAGAVTGVALGTAGTNYTTAPTVALSAPPASSQATGTAVLNGKTLGSITSLLGGGYYTVAPTVGIGPPSVAVTAAPGAITKPLFYGGGQERGLRPGTLPVALVAALGAAAELAHRDQKKRAKHCRAIKAAAMKAFAPLKPRIHGRPDDTMDHVLNLAFPRIDSEALIVALKDLVAISNGSACTSSSYTPSHVMKAMGYSDDEANEAIRLSWCHLTPEVDWNALAERVRGLY